MTRSLEETGPAETRRELRADSLSAGFAFLVLLTVGQRMLGFVRQLILCRMLDPAEVGRWNLAFSMIILAAPLMVLGIPGTFGRYTEYYRQRGQLHAFVTRTLWVTTMLTLAGVAGLLCLARPMAWLLFRDAEQHATVSVLGLALLTIIAFNATIELLTSLRQVKAVSWLRFGFSGLFFVFSLAVVILDDSVHGIILSYAAASLVIALWAGVMLWKALRGVRADDQPLGGRAVWSKLLPFAGWLWLADLLSNLFAASDRYMIVHFVPMSPETAAGIVGQYHSSRLVPEQLYGLALLLCGVLLPYLSHDWERGERSAVFEKLNLSFKGYALSMTLCGAIFLGLAPWLFDSVLGGKYTEGLRVAPFALVSFIWYGLFAIAQTYLLCCEKGRLCSVALSLGLLANIALNYLFLPHFGLLGAVGATAAANALALGLAMHLSARQGMPWSPGITLTALLPVTLLLGWFATLAVVLCGLTACRYRSMYLSSSELEQFRTAWQATLVRLGSLRLPGRAWIAQRSSPMNP